jgi:membrane-bound ClpP family serine protease
MKSKSESSNKGWLKPNKIEHKATTFSHDPARERDPLIGLEAKTVTNLHPTGEIRVKGRCYDAVAEGTFIGPNEKVRITGARDFRLIVERIS